MRNLERPMQTADPQTSELDGRPLPPAAGRLQIQRELAGGTLASEEQPQSATVLVPAEDPLPGVLAFGLLVCLAFALVAVFWFVKAEPWLKRRGWI